MDSIELGFIRLTSECGESFLIRPSFIQMIRVRTTLANANTDEYRETGATILTLAGVEHVKDLPSEIIAKMAEVARRGND